MKTFRSQAIVLRTRKLGESDKIITLFTKDYGIRHAVARGVRKTTSKLGARVEPFNCVDVQLYQGRSLDTVVQVEIVNAYSASLSKDLSAFAAASLICELTEKLLFEDEVSLPLYSLLNGGLFSLCYRGFSPTLVANSFCLRALAVSGWALSCYKCAVCGVDGWHEYFNVYSGGAMCVDCRESGCVRVCVDSMKVLADLFVGEWGRLSRVDQACVREVTGVVNAYVHWHLEKRLKSAQVRDLL